MKSKKVNYARVDHIAETLQSLNIRDQRLPKKLRSKCCDSRHMKSYNIPTKRSEWCKGAIDLGVFNLVVPCPHCHPKYFKQYMTELVKEKPDWMISEISKQ